MRIDIYTNTNETKFAAVRAGAELPPDAAAKLGNAKIWKSRELRRGRPGLVGADATDVINSIEGQGYFLLPAA